MSLRLSLRLLPGIFSLALTAAWLVPVASADVTISVAPSLVELRATPGGLGSQQLTVYNDGSEPFQAVVSIQQYKDGSGVRSAVDWLRVEPAALDLPPGTRQTVKVNISAPQDATPGGRYAMVAFQTGAKAVNGSGAGVSAQLGVPFLITLDSGPAIVKQAGIERLLPVLETDGKVGFRAMLTNHGNMHVASGGGDVEVKRDDGSAVGRLRLPESTAILPGSSELLKAEGTLPLQQGLRYQARGLIAFGGSAPAAKEMSFNTRVALAALGLGQLENPDRGPTLQFTLRNDGDLGLAPRVQLAVQGPDGRPIGVAFPARQPLIWPGETAAVEANYPGRLNNGEYKLIAKADYGASAPLQEETSFRIGLPPVPNAGWGTAPERTRQTEFAPQFRLAWWPFAAGALGLIFAFAVASAMRRTPAMLDIYRRSRRAMRILWGAE